jgi:RNA polymerase sigma-70 factor (ECF subfamily)
MELSDSFPPHVEPGQALPAEVWIEPALDRDLLPSQADPAQRAILRDSIRLAFIAILQHLSARQRAVLVLRDVLGWHAAEVAALLDTTEVAVNSILQRAHTALRAARPSGDLASEPSSADQREIVDRYADAFERYDIETLVSLLHDEAGMSMPPLVMWLRGIRDVRAFHLGSGVHCKGSRLVSVAVNGCPGFAQYLAPGPDSRREPWAIQVLEIEAGKIVHVHNFLDTSLFWRFGLPAYLEG